MPSAGPAGLCFFRVFEVISGVNVRTQNLAASTQEISATTALIMETVDQVSRELDHLAAQSRED